MRRREFLALTAATAALPRLARAADKPPNIILILTDDQGYGDLGRNGNPLLRTPHLDRLYDQSAHFEDFHVSPTCSPTRACLLTGRHEFRNGVSHTIRERERLTLAATTLPQVLKSAGYTTGIFGKWHLGDEAPYQPDKRGFDEVYIHGGGGIGQSYPGSCGDAPGNRYTDPTLLHNGRFEGTKGFCTDLFFAQAQRWIGEVKGKQPFFCYVPTNAPHGPLSCPPEYERLYADKVDKQTAIYLGMVANIDDNVGRLLGKLREWDLERDTVVIFMNDNGGTGGVKVFNAGMAGGKGTARNGGTRAMSLWRWPGHIPPGPRTQLTAHLDVLPTLAQLAGAQLPPVDLDGYSLVPLLERADAPWRDERVLFTHVGRWAVGDPPAKYGPCSVRWRQYLYFPGPKRGDLYDLKADPGERHDIAAEHADVVKQLDAAYDRWWTSVLPGLVNEDAYKTAPAENPFKVLYRQQFGL